MPRSMSSAMKTAIAADLLPPALFVTATFATGPIYVWSGNFPIVWNSLTWVGIGSLGGVSVIEESSTVEAKGITLTLSGFDAGLLANVLAEVQLGAPVTVYLGFFDPTAPTLIATPIPAWAGRMDQPTIDVDGKKGNISINCENRLMDMNTPVDRRYTIQDAQIFAPGDEGFNFVSGIQEITVYWGAVPNNANNI